MVTVAVNTLAVGAGAFLMAISLYSIYHKMLPRPLAYLCGAVGGFLVGYGLKVI